MKTTFRDYPITALILLLLACMKFEYNGLNWTVRSPGLPAGFALLIIFAVVMIYKIFKMFNAVQDVLVSRGIIPSRIRCKYDLLIPIGILAVCYQGRWMGDPFKSELGSSGYRWELIWGDYHWAAPFIFALVGVVLLFCAFELCRAIVQTPPAPAQNSTARE